MIREVQTILKAAESFLPGDFVVHRALPRRELRRVGGFVFLDHFDQPDITPELFDVPPHPHIGLQTVTYLYDGKILHTDSLDNVQEITPGDVNWMTAGSGITHAEQVTKPIERIHGLQSWVGLPHDKRKTAPDFAHFPKTDLPRIDGEGYTATVIAGSVAGSRSPIPTFQELLYLDIRMGANSAIELPVTAEHELAVYVTEGEIDMEGVSVLRHDLAKLSTGDVIRIAARTNAMFVLFGGEPLPEPTVIYWNFVADTLGEAKQAALDWEAGKFPPVNKYRKIASHDEDSAKEISKLL